MANETSEAKPKSKMRKIVEAIIYSIVGLFLVASITISILTIYHNNRYETFFVDGQSMYPTLNYNAKYPNGRLIGERRIGDVEGTYDVDYGFMDTHEDAINNLKRFDIVVCRFSEGSPKLIKRLIVLPGETFYFTTADEGSEENGNLYVKGVGESEFKLIEQPIDSKIVHGGVYNIKAKYNNKETGYTLASDEYFVCGDNRYRSNSVDCRERDSGITRNNMLAKVVGLEGYCTVKYNEQDATYKAVDIKYYFPKRF